MKIILIQWFNNHFAKKITIIYNTSKNHEQNFPHFLASICQLHVFLVIFGYGCTHFHVLLLIYIFMHPSTWKHQLQQFRIINKCILITTLKDTRYMLAFYNVKLFTHTRERERERERDNYLNNCVVSRIIVYSETTI